MNMVNITYIWDVSELPPTSMTSSYVSSLCRFCLSCIISGSYLISSFWFYADILYMKLNIELIVSVSGGAMVSTLMEIPLIMLDVHVWICINSQWYLWKMDNCIRTEIDMWSMQFIGLYSVPSIHDPDNYVPHCDTRFLSSNNLI